MFAQLRRESVLLPLVSGKADAGREVGDARCLQILVENYVMLTRHFLLKQGVCGQEPRLVQKVYR